jgi:hypothetical protein
LVMPSYITIVSVLAAACEGTARLSETLGRTVILIDAAIDPVAHVASLRRDQHGSVVPCPNSFKPFHAEAGWDRWLPFPLEPAPGAPSSTGPASFVDGYLKVVLPDHVAPSEYREQLAGMLRHLRFDEAARRPDWIERSFAAEREILVKSRYTPRAAPPSVMRTYFRPEGCRLVRDVYAIDPAEEPGRILCYALAALAAATGDKAPYEDP